MGRLNDLAMSLSTRFQQTGQTEDLEDGDPKSRSSSSVYAWRPHAPCNLPEDYFYFFNTLYKSAKKIFRLNYIKYSQPLAYLITIDWIGALVGVLRKIDPEYVRLTLQKSLAGDIMESVVRNYL